MRTLWEAYLCMCGIDRRGLRLFDVDEKVVDITRLRFDGERLGRWNASEKRRNNVCPAGGRAGRGYSGVVRYNLGGNSGVSGQCSAQQTGHRAGGWAERARAKSGSAASNHHTAFGKHHHQAVLDTSLLHRPFLQQLSRRNNHPTPIYKLRASILEAFNRFQSNSILLCCASTLRRQAHQFLRPSFGRVLVQHPVLPARELAIDPQRSVNSAATSSRDIDSTVNILLDATAKQPVQPHSPFRSLDTQRGSSAASAWPPTPTSSAWFQRPA